MKHKIFLILSLIIILAFIACTNKPKPVVQKELKNRKVLLNQIPEVNTISEIKVYNDFIDQVYKINYCHLEMDTPKEYLSYHQNLSKKEIIEYKKKFELYMKHHNEMLDTSKIIAFVPDSLKEFKMPYSYLNENLDSNNLKLFQDLILDTIILPTTSYNLDSLKSKKIFFERLPFHRTDLDSISQDSLYKYYDKVTEYWQHHVGRQIGNKYYIGTIDLSRVKFNRDSTLCALECGYLAQSKCGYGNYILLKKINSKWTILKTIGSWVS